MLPGHVDLAALVLAAGGADAGKLERAARQLVERTPAAREALASLERMAADLGGKPAHESWTDGVVALHADLDRLLETRWQDPAEVLDPTGDFGVDHVRLIRICRARLARSSADAAPAALSRVLDRLLSSYGRTVRRPRRGGGSSWHGNW